MRNIRVEFGFYLFLACGALLLPIKLLFAWLLAVAVHEVFHLLVLRCFRVQIFSFRITSRGAVIETEPLPGYKECICALAGPLGGLLLLLLRRWLPFTAICGLLHSCYNLIPIYPLDGGRAVRSGLIWARNLKASEKYLANKRNK